MEQPRCHLLALPAELRNHIYSLVLVKTNPITVSQRGYGRPGLLLTCHAIRNEAISMYYANNHFTIKVQDYNIQNFQTFLARKLKLIRRVKWKLSMTRADPHWSNLLAWLEWCHKGEYRETHFRVDDAPLRGIRAQAVAVAGLFAQVLRMRHVSWKIVKSVAEGMRPVLVRLAREWNLDIGSSKAGVA